MKVVKLKMYAVQKHSGKRRSHGVRESVEGENMLGVNSLHELTGGMN